MALCSLLVGAGCNAEPTTVATATAALTVPTVRRPAPPADCPEGMARVDDFCIDRFEAHLVDAGAPSVLLPHCERPPSRVKYMAASSAGAKPQAYISRVEAARACRAADKRLCTARQWHRACGGTRGSRYPYGDQPLAGRCNTGKPHLMTKLFGGETKYTYDAHYNNPRLALEPGFLAASGEYRDCVNDWGVHDMVGNLHEWVADPVSRKLEKEVPLEFGPHGLGHDGSGVFMGGYFSSAAEHGHGCTYVTATHSPNYHDYSIGFRCCSDLAAH